ncbi:universal stress protein [Salegentibacter flavus]|uniref:Nucleotide-binding universal stress protein, UspA family n=1 Tax=Salegentibacter flavus TaxID=287099 RepID=A0A1I5BZX3_9FLAO|nr:universal stress protein [Salegentibacter flavus]SFN80310.1 Nucleotide-binding universal stress protein, UspA family [Salegentibacter flavus]
MNKRNRILVLIDFSSNTENLIDFAFSIAEIVNAKVIFVHQIPGLVPAMADEESRREIIKGEANEAYSKLRKLAKDRIYSDDSFQISEKPILAFLKELSSPQYFDWVFTGLKEGGVLKPLFIGSTTLSVIDESEMLTVTVPTETKMNLPEKLLVGVHPNYELNREHLNSVLTALENNVKEIEFFTILKETEEEQSAREHLLKLQSEYKSFKSEIQIYKGNDATSALREKMKQSHNSFLVLQQGSRSLTDKLFRKFTINELVYRAQTPLLVLSK